MKAALILILSASAALAQTNSVPTDTKVYRLTNTLAECIPPDTDRYRLVITTERYVSTIAGRTFTNDVSTTNMTRETYTLVAITNMDIRCFPPLPIPKNVPTRVKAGPPPLPK